MFAHKFGIFPYVSGSPHISLSMFDGLIEPRLASLIAASADTSQITELRMRQGRALIVMTLSGERKVVKGALGSLYIVSRADIDRVLSVASNFSIYAINDELVRGYIPRGSVRIGIAGEGICESGKLLTVKEISYLTIRIPHQIYGAADGVEKIVLGDGVKNTLIISPPGAGKTTMLRELARLSSAFCNTLIIDERLEIAAAEGGGARLDVGDCDVISGVSKTIAYENCIRAMNPDIIVTDEIFKKQEVDAVIDIVRSGVKVFASVHGNGVESLENSEIFAPLLSCFEVAIVLSKTPKVGIIKEVKVLHSNGKMY